MDCDVGKVLLTMVTIVFQLCWNLFSEPYSPNLSLGAEVGPFRNDSRRPDEVSVFDLFSTAFVSEPEYLVDLLFGLPFEQDVGSPLPFTDIEFRTIFIFLRSNSPKCVQPKFRKAVIVGSFESKTT